MVGHETITKQMIYFVQSMIPLFGNEILPLIQEFGIICCTRLPYEMLEDTFNLFSYA